MFRTPLISAESVALGVACALAGCGRITVAPTCPQTLAVGESGLASANPTDPGAVPTYEWEVVPAAAGTFSDPTAENTTFTAAKEGTAILRLTASDSIYLVLGQCQVVVAASSGVEVALTADVASPLVGDTITLTCESTGETAAVSTSFEQTGGAAVGLTPIGGGGQATFVPAEAGDFAFRCTGFSPGGAASESADLTVTVSEAGGGRPPRR